MVDVSVRRSFERGQVILRSGETVDAAAYEALNVLGLLEPTNRRWQEVARAALVSIIVVVITGLYMARFKPDLFRSSRFMALLGASSCSPCWGRVFPGFTVKFISIQPQPSR